ncbi:MAG: tyrosine-type recombinase/integrase [PVC group bacterium]|nr:tyrosine-type recombinase/integrase [PVC group bacterium]
MAKSYKRDGIWYVRYKDRDGRWRKKSCGKKAIKADAEFLVQMYGAKEMNYRHKAPVKIINVELLEAIKEFRDTVIPIGIRVDKEKSSIIREQTIIDLFSDYLKDNSIKSFKEIMEKTIRGYINKRFQDGRKANTRVKDRRILNRFFSWAVKQSYCAENPVESIEGVKIIPKHPRYFTEEELKKIFVASKDPYTDIYKFLYLTGIRIGELGNLEWRDYNEKQKYITIRVMPGNKTKREETVPLNNDALEILRKRKAAKDNDTYIFVNAEKNKLDNANIYRNLKRILKHRKIKDASPHTFRHTTASHMVIKGISIYTVKDVLRHKSVRETEIYAHLSEDAVRKAVESLSCENF